MSEAERWYLGFSSKGNPENFLNEITQYIYREELTDYVPLVRVERQSRRLGGEFYFFVAIVSNKAGEVPAPVAQKILVLPKFKKQIKKVFCLEDIRRMVGKSEYATKSYGQTIKYQSTHKTEYPKAEILETRSSDWNKTFSAEAQITFNRFLIWLSTQQQGSWYQFCKTCQIMEIEYPNRILQYLRLLGHLETSSDWKRWSIAPPMACQKRDHYLIYGQRIPAWLERVKLANVQIQELPQPEGNAPSCIRLLTTDPDIVRQIGWIPISDCTSQLTELLPVLSEWKEQLTSLAGIVSSLKKWKRFDGRDFVDCGIPHETGFYEMYMEDGKKIRSLWYEHESEKWLQGDWYGLRFMGLHELGGILIASYDPSNEILRIPISQRWPEPYERALVLSSGLLPTRSQDWLFYGDVSGTSAQQLCEKLNVRLEVCHE